MGWLLFMESVFAHKLMTDDYKVTLLATRFCGYAAILVDNYQRDLLYKLQELKQGSNVSN